MYKLDLLKIGTAAGEFLERQDTTVEEDAVDILKVVEGLGYQITKKPEAWDGEGLPPVGTECEVSNCGNPFEFCEIKYMGDKVCVVGYDVYGDQHYHLSSVKFRPIRTEEEKLIDQLIKDARCDGDNGEYSENELLIAKKLISIGWRPNNQ